MADEELCIRLHHQGEFLKTKYSGGSYIKYNMDPDLFSYSVLMEWVKDNQYEEIGGVYVNKGKMGGWTLLTDDRDLGEYIKGAKTTGLNFYIDTNVDKGIDPVKQMQPHVIVRPRPSPVVGKEKKLSKRKFVTLPDVQNEQKRRLSTRKKLQFEYAIMNPLRVASAVTNHKNQNEFMDEDVAVTDDKIQDESMDEEVAVTDDRNQLVSMDEDVAMTGEKIQHESMEEEDLVKNTVKLRRLTKYEILREKNIQQNARRLALLNLDKLSASIQQSDKGKSKASSDQSEEYCPSDDNEEDSAEEEIVTTEHAKTDTSSIQQKKILDRAEVRTGPTTRSRATKAIVACNKEVQGSLSIEANDASVVVSPGPASGKQIKRQNINGAGSMAAYIEMQERQKQTQSQTEKLQSQGDDQTAKETQSEAYKRKCRGKTKMDYVHLRRAADKKEIKLNERHQPVADDDKLLSEFSKFLGTIARQYVSLNCVNWHQIPDKNTLWDFVTEKYIIPEQGKEWVLRTMRDAWRVNKCRIKKKHYSAYDNDDERIKNKPDDIPLDEFKVLLKYWGDEQVKAAAEKNSSNRMLIKDTHTAGPRSFAQISNKMKLEKSNNESPSKAELFVQTRKRSEGRTYKPSDSMVNEKISQIEKLCSSEGNIESADHIISGDTSHSSSWLLERHIRKRHSKEKLASTIPNILEKYVAELTTRIREELTDEMNKKVTWMMRKLAEQNPDLKVDIDELCAKPSVDVSSDGDNVTP